MNTDFVLVPTDFYKQIIFHSLILPIDQHIIRLTVESLIYINHFQKSLVWEIYTDFHLKSRKTHGMCLNSLGKAAIILKVLKQEAFLSFPDI